MSFPYFVRRLKSNDRASVISPISIKSIRKYKACTKRLIIQLNDVATAKSFSHIKVSLSTRGTLHRGFLESAGWQNYCDHVNALPHSTAGS